MLDIHILQKHHGRDMLLFSIPSSYAVEASKERKKVDRFN